MALYLRSCRKATIFFAGHRIYLKKKVESVRKPALKNREFFLGSSWERPVREKKINFISNQGYFYFKAQGYYCRQRADTTKDKKKLFPRLNVVLVTSVNYPWRLNGKVSVAVLISTNTR